MKTKLCLGVIVSDNNFACFFKHTLLRISVSVSHFFMHGRGLVRENRRSMAQSKTFNQVMMITERVYGKYESWVVQFKSC